VVKLKSGMNKSAWSYQQQPCQRNISLLNNVLNGRRGYGDMPTHQLQARAQPGALLECVPPGRVNFVTLTGIAFHQEYRHVEREFF
jgi:hypothetical protein